MATIPIHNPQSPFLGHIPGGLRVGSVLKIRASIQGYSNRCEINIQSGPALKPRDDVMLNVSIRPQENVIVRNHLQNQIAGQEERFGGNPVQAHQSFEIAIQTDPLHYKIMINDQHFCVFTHRLPLHLAQYVSISGTCSIQYIITSFDSVGVTPGPVYPIHRPVPQPPMPRPPRHHHHHHHHIQVCPVPPPMPPPPYPGSYPNQTATPYTVFKHELMDKMHNLKHHHGHHHKHGHHGGPHIRPC